VTARFDASPYVTTFERALSAMLASRYAGKDAVSDAVTYVMGGPGKRVRPTLTLLVAEALGGEIDAALAPALAVELVHCYSLVHDALPCMDDDHLRRGRATAHMDFGDANALLAGDALLTDAFALLAEASTLTPAQRIACVRELATAAGGGGMVLGQSLDLHWTARSGATRQDLDRIHTLKTGALLGAAAATGAIAGGADDRTTATFRAFGQRLGLAFQILDDLIDGDGATGKTPGKDAAAAKLTYLTMMSAADARAAADAATAEARALLAATGARVDALNAFSGALLERAR
jgi:geranylgeranyl pyrophosphate synthase